MKLKPVITAFVVALFLSPLPAGAGQFKVLKTFPNNALDGATPANLAPVIVGSKLYGVTYAGGTNGMGVLYWMNLDGTGFEKLRDFSLAEGRPGENYNYSGSGLGNLVSSGDRIFGTLNDSSPSNWEGRIWARQLGFSGVWSELVQAEWSEIGGEPLTSFIDGNWIYGFTRWGGGNNGKGAVFRVSLDGASVEALKVFRGGSDGENVQQIILADGSIYGVTAYGGAAGKGTIFKMNKDGAGFTTLTSFTGADTRPQSIVFLQGKIYGVSNGGGNSTPSNLYPDGFLFSVNTNGTEYKILKTFNDDNDQLDSPACLATDGTLLYIAMNYGGPDNADGGLISIKPDGTGQKTLVEFSSANNGTTGKRTMSMIFSGGRLYGANGEGGSGQTGTLWSYDSGSAGDPPPYTGPLYGTVTFSGSISTVQELTRTERTSRGITTTVNPQRMVSTRMSNALLLERARVAGLLSSTGGYSIVCTDTDGKLAFYAYKRGSSLVSLEPLLSLAETGVLQAVTTTDIYNSATDVTKTSEVGTDKLYGEGNFFGMQISSNRTVSYRSSDAMINGQMSRYYPGTSRGTFFGVDGAGTEFVEGTFSIAAPTTIQVP